MNNFHSKKNEVGEGGFWEKIRVTTELTGKCKDNKNPTTLAQLFESDGNRLISQKTELFQQFFPFISTYFPNV